MMRKTEATNENSILIAHVAPAKHMLEHNFWYAISVARVAIKKVLPIETAESVMFV